MACCTPPSPQWCAVISWLFLACTVATEDSAVVPLDPTLTNVQAEVFNKSCAFSTCHGDGGGSAGLSLVDGVSYVELINVPAEGDAETGVPVGEIRVVAGDADGSYLIKKMEATDDIVGERMPAAAALDESRLSLVRAWVENGALDD